MNIKYWLPRILSLMYVLFLSVFSLDVFDSKLNFWQIVIGLIMHNIPTFIVLLIILYSWKHQLFGGIIFLLIGLLYNITLFINPNFEWYMLSWSVLISGPAFLIGILFLKEWKSKKIVTIKL